MMDRAERVVTAAELAGILRVEVDDVLLLRGLGVLCADERGAFPLLRNLQAWMLAQRTMVAGGVTGGAR